jgi:peptide deformylase
MIITNNEEALKINCINATLEEVGPLIEQLENELKRSAEMGREGIGLAAPQIGIGKNVAIVRMQNISINLVNCKIAQGFDKQIFEQEGCLSFPGRYEKTLRFQEIYVVDNLIDSTNFVVTGLAAVVVQHEIDHLNKILLPDNAIVEKINKIKQRPNDPCSCGSLKKYKKCCGK